MEPRDIVVGIVVLSWNRRERVMACVERLERLVDAERHRIVVVDNASTDGSVAALRARYPRVVVAAQETNRGFVGGVNAGLREAKRLGCTHGWLVNDDTTFGDDVLPTLLSFVARTPDARLFSPVIRNDDSSRDLQFANGVVDWRRSATHDEVSPDAFARLTGEGATPVLIGTALLVDLRVLDRVDGFDPAFFAYWEDIDFCVRCADAGFASRLVPDATVLHDAPPRLARPPHYFYYLLRNEALFWKRHARPGARGWRRRWLAKALHFLAENRDHGLEANARACADAVWDATRGRFGPRDAHRPAPRWFHRLASARPHLFVMLLEGELGAVVRQLRAKTRLRRA